MDKTDRLLNEDKLKIIAKQLRKPEGDVAIQVGEKMNESNRLINLSTIEALGLNPTDRILEIGMGNGFFVKDIFALHDTIHYSGCDYSEIMVDQAVKNNEQLIKAGKAEFYVAGAGQLPFENEVFDKVFSVNTIYFWESPEKELAEIGRVLKPEGQLVISLRPKSSMEKYPFVKEGFNMFTTSDLSYLLSENHFKVTDCLEKAEPEQEIGGEKMTVEILIVVAEKK